MSEYTGKAPGTVLALLRQSKSELPSFSSSQVLTDVLIIKKPNSQFPEPSTSHLNCKTIQSLYYFTAILTVSTIWIFGHSTLNTGLVG